MLNQTYNKQGQKTKSLIPSEYADKAGLLETESERVAKLRDAFLHGLIQSEVCKDVLFMADELLVKWICSFEITFFG